MMLIRLRDDLRHAMRSLRRTPGFTIGVGLTLALALGTTASVFAVVERVILNPLPYPHSDRVVLVQHAVARVGASFPVIPPGVYWLYADRARTLESIAAFRAEALTLTGAGEPESVRTIRTTSSLSAVLQSSPSSGRWLTDRDSVPGAPQVAVLSYGFWMRRFGGDAAAIGQRLVLSGVPTTIVGVMPRAFTFFSPAIDVWLPEPMTRASGFGLFTYFSVARLRPGVSIEQARSEMDALIATLPQVYAGNALAESLAREHMRSTAPDLREAMVLPVSRILWSLFAAAGVVLIVACANIANLFMVRAETRRRDVAVRLAIGASWTAAARHSVVESLVLSLCGGVAGGGVAAGAVRLLVKAAPQGLPRVEEIHLDATVLVAMLIVAVAIGVTFGLIPLLYRAPLAVTLRTGVGGHLAATVRQRTRQVLIAGQIAMALMLVIASGLMVESFQRLRAASPGFDADSALTFRLELPSRAYATRAAAAAAIQRVVEDVGATPGVASVAAATRLPLSPAGGFGNTIRIDRQGADQPNRPVATFNAVTGGFFETMGMPILRGRGITRDDVERREPVVVINQALADSHFPGENPLDREIFSSVPPPLTSMRLRIVGVVGNTPLTQRVEPKPVPMLYMPASIAGGPDIPARMLVGPDITAISFVVRARQSPTVLVPALRRVVANIDSRLAVADIDSLDATLDRASAPMQFTMMLLLLAAVVALTLGVVGVYAVMSYIVAQRTGEIGIRMALGAEPRNIARLVIREGGAIALVGIGVGIAVALGGTRFIESLLYGVSPRDAGVFGITSAIVMMVALAACWLPARRAARVDPIVALRAE